MNALAILAIHLLTTPAHARCLGPARAHVLEAQVLNCSTVNNPSRMLEKKLGEINLSQWQERVLRQQREIYVEVREIRQAAVPFEVIHSSPTKVLEASEIFSLDVSSAPKAYTIHESDCSKFPSGTTIRGFIWPRCCDVHPFADLGCLFGLDEISVRPERGNTVLNFLNRANHEPQTEQRFYDATLSAPLLANPIAILGKITNISTPTLNNNYDTVSIEIEKLLKHEPVANPYVARLIAPQMEIPVKFPFRTRGHIEVGMRAIWIIRYANNTLWMDDISAAWPPARVEPFVRTILERQASDSER